MHRILTHIENEKFCISVTKEKKKKNEHLIFVNHCIFLIGLIKTDILTIKDKYYSVIDKYK